MRSVSAKSGTAQGDWSPATPPARRAGDEIRAPATLVEATLTRSRTWVRFPPSPSLPRIARIYGGFGPVTASAPLPSKSMRGLIGIRGAIAAVAGLGMWAPGSATAIQSQIPASVRASLRAVAQRAARENGDSHPRDIQVVETTANEAARIDREPPYSSSGPGALVYLVALRGHFVCESCSPPKGIRLPHGSVITLTLAVNNTEGFGTAFGIKTRYPNLRAAGTPVKL